MSITHAWARFYAGLGWSIIPIKMSSKIPHCCWKAHQTVRPMIAQIDQWWAEWPYAGVGLILGSVSGIVAVDSDSSEAHELLLSKLGGVPGTLRSRSGSQAPGKYHYFFQNPEFPTRATLNPLHKKLELRGEKGYVVLPPSLHASGNRYEWNPYPDQNAAVQSLIAPLPPVLAEIWQTAAEGSFRGVRPTTQGRQTVALPPTVRTLAQVEIYYGISRPTSSWLRGEFSEAERWNDRLFQAACDMSGSGVPIEVAQPLLLHGARPWTSGDNAAAIATIQSAYESPRISACDYAAAINSQTLPRTTVRLSQSVRGSIRRGRR